MAREIDDYESLQEAIQDWLNRADLVARIPTFIYLAERKIFRRYRMPNNEKTVTYNMRAVPEYDSLGSGNSDNQIALASSIDLQSDYLETLTMQANGKPLERLSLTKMQSLRASNPGEVGPIKFFARERGAILFHPFPDGDTVIKWIYYCDLSGNLTADSSDLDVLRTAPDLYLYGSLLQAEPFLKPEEDEYRLLPVWKKMYDEGFVELEFQRDEDERSGSNVEVQSSYHPRGRRGVRG